MLRLTLKNHHVPAKAHFNLPQQPTVSDQAKEGTAVFWPWLGFWPRTGSFKSPCSCPTKTTVYTPLWFIYSLSFSLVLTPLECSRTWNATLRFLTLFFLITFWGLLEVASWLQSWKTSQYVCVWDQSTVHSFFQNADSLQKCFQGERYRYEGIQMHIALFMHFDALFGYMYWKLLPVSCQYWAKLACQLWCHFNGIRIRSISKVKKKNQEMTNICNSYFNKPENYWHMFLRQTLQLRVCPSFTYTTMTLLLEVNQPWNKVADIRFCYVCHCLRAGRALTPTYTTIITIRQTCSSASYHIYNLNSIALATFKNVDVPLGWKWQCESIYPIFYLKNPNMTFGQTFIVNTSLETITLYTIFHPGAASIGKD